MSGHVAWKVAGCCLLAVLAAAGSLAQQPRAERPTRQPAVDARAGRADARPRAGAVDARTGRTSPRAAVAPPIAAAVAAQPPVAEPQPLLVKRDTTDRRLLLRADLVTKKSIPLYRAAENKVLFEVAVSPASRYTAVLESTDGVVVDGEYQVPPRNELVVLDAAGREVRRVQDNVQRYLFSPDEKQIAYIVGDYYEGGVGFLPRGAFLMDIATGATEPIAAADPYELGWATGGRENAVLLRVLADEPPKKVLRYDVAARRVSTVPSGAFHVSPDGAFYLEQSYELIERGSCRPERGGAGCVELRDRSSGEPVSKPPATLGKVVGWAQDAGHALLVAQEKRSLSTAPLTLGRATLSRLVAARATVAETAVWDVASRRVVETAKGLPMTAATPETWVTGKRTTLLARPATTAQPGRELERIFVKPRRVQPPP